MKFISKSAFYDLAKSEKLQLLREVAQPYSSGFVPNGDHIYALNKENNLVAFYSGRTLDYCVYDKPMRSFSRKDRKFIKCKIIK